MADINLHSIFRTLVDDENFLLTIIDNDKNISEKKNKTTDSGFNIMKSIITEYILLTPYDKQSHDCFPLRMKTILPPDYHRLGIKNITDRNLDIVNISFLNSLNILLRPELFQLSVDDQITNVFMLEEFICNKIRRNYQIDRVKKTKKMKETNEKLINDLREGKISHDIIQYIVNIFEINLIVFDLSKSTIHLYWTCGTKYPYLNLFKRIYCLSFIQGNYEPVMPIDHATTIEQDIKIYNYILLHPDEFDFIGKLELGIQSLSYILSWNLPLDSLLKIIENFFHKKHKTLEDHLIAFKKLKK